MLASVAAAFSEAFRNLRSNFFQTFLSVLGIIIGVGALVTMLALIDGLEQLARDGIADSSSMESVNIRRNTSKRVDGLQVAMEETIHLTAGTVDSLLAELPYPAKRQIYTSDAVMVPHPDSALQLAVRYFATSLPMADEPDAPAFGRMLSGEDRSAEVAVINHSFAKRLVGEDVATALGKHIEIVGTPLEVVGIMPEEDLEPFMLAMLPLSVLDAAAGPIDYEAAATVNFAMIEDVKPGKEFIEEWFGDRYPEIEEPVAVRASIELVEQLEMGFTVFRLVMGFLIGIAVVVGGVGVMNVLLMSITERTAEIGVRKAVGANRRRIITQFLSESVAISAIGSLFGLVAGMLMALLSAAVISMVAEFDFVAVFSWQTMMVVGLIALLTGIVFGTYPARRAAGLDPVRAIQRT